jgi:hypothetical protein
VLDERPIGRWDFEGGGHVRIVVGGDVDTESALEMAETLIKLKRQELNRTKRAPKQVEGPALGEQDSGDKAYDA